MNNVRSFITCVWKMWQKDDIPRHAAVIAFHSVFALPSLAIVVITIAGWFVGERTMTQELFSRITLYAGADIANLLLRAMENLQTQSTHPLLSLTGALFLLFSSLNVLRRLRVSLNDILQSDSTPLRWRQRVMGYGLSFIVLLFSVVLLLSSVILNAALSFMEQRLTAIIDFPWTTIGWTNTGVTFVGLSAFLALLYRLLPDVRLSMKNILRSALITAALMMMSAWLFTVMVTLFPIGQAYGVAATLLVLLLWIDVMAMIFFLGAEILSCSNTHEKHPMHH